MLSFIGIINPLDYPMKENLTFWTDNNAETLGSRYLFPLNLTVILDTVRIPFLNTFGIFCGLSHEPHIATLFITPAFFFSIYLFKNIKLTLILCCYVFFMLIATSTTNLLIFFPLLIFWIFLKRKHNTSSPFSIWGIIIILILLYFISSSEIIIQLTDFLNAKLYSQGGSLDYSQSFLKYIIEPKSLFGYGVWKIPYPHANVDDIGFVGMISMFGIFILFFKYIISNLMNKSFYPVGCAGLYFLLHSLKIPQLTLIYPYTFYILFILILCSRLGTKIKVNYYENYKITNR